MHPISCNSSHMALTVISAHFKVFAIIRRLIPSSPAFVIHIITSKGQRKTVIKQERN